MKSFKEKPMRVIGFTLCLISLLFFTGASNRRSDAEIFSKGKKNVVYFVPQFSTFGEISSGEMHFLKKVLKEAEKNNVKAVIFELDTPGGRVDIAYKYASILEKSKVPTIAYINPHGISAGAIIALAANRIAITSNGLIGDAMPVLSTFSGQVIPLYDHQSKFERENEDLEEKKKAEKKKDSKNIRNEKNYKPETAQSKELKKLKEENEKLRKQVESKKAKKKKYKSTAEDLAAQKQLTVFFKKLQTFAEKNDRPARVIRAFADPYQKLTKEKDGIEHTKISPLTLSAKEAEKLHVVDYVCDSPQEILDSVGLGGCQLEVIKKSSIDQLSSFLTYPLIAGVLIMLGITGLYVEIRTPGFGVAGVLGITALTLFFLGHMGTGASEWGPVVIFFVGMVLLGLEIFVIPGFGLVGLLGITCIVISFFAAFGFDNFATATQTISLSLLGAIALMTFLTIYVLPKSKLFKWLKLDTAQHQQEGYMSHKKVSSELVHQFGVAYTTLRPVGTALINNKKYEVTTNGDYVEKGEEIEVIEATPMKIVVKKV